MYTQKKKHTHPTSSESTTRKDLQLQKLSEKSPKNQKQVLTPLRFHHSFNIFLRKKSILITLENLNNASSKGDKILNKKKTYCIVHFEALGPLQESPRIYSGLLTGEGKGEPYFP